MAFRFFKNRTAIRVGIASTIFIIVVIYLVGNIIDYEAKLLIEDSIPKYNMLFNTITLACATILALLLTALSTSLATKSKIKESHYHDILVGLTITIALMLQSVIVNIISIAGLNNKNHDLLVDEENQSEQQ